jgi:hypothetical protein
MTFSDGHTPITFKICDHLSTEGDIFEYYGMGGTVHLVSGCCLCSDCYGRTFNGDVDAIAEECLPVTQSVFQAVIVNLLYEVNKMCMNPEHMH